MPAYRRGASVVVKPPESADRRVRSTPASPLVLLMLMATSIMLVSRCPGPLYLDPPPPSTRIDEAAPPPPRLSTIGVPVAIPIDLLVGLVEEAVPRTFGDLSTLRPLQDRDRVSVAFELERSPFRASLVDDVARLRTEIRYRVRMSYGLPLLPDINGSCGDDDDEEPPGLTVAIDSPISLDEDWSLRTRSRVVEVRPSSPGDRDRCEVTFLGIDITERVVARTRAVLEERIGEIDGLTARVDTRSRFASWWATLQEPIALGDSLWLMMGPEEVRRGALRGSGDSVAVDLALRSRPRIVVGPRPRDVARPLPPLDSGAVRPGLDLIVDARAEYESASKLLSERLGGRVIQVGRRTLRLESLSVWGVGSGGLAIEVRVTGDVRGRMYLTGSPSIDARTGHISVPDLDLDLATRNVLVSTASAFLGDELRDYLRERAVWPAAPAVQWLSYWLDQGLNRRITDDLRVAGVVDTVEIVSATPLRDALLVRLAARGSASLVVGN